MKYFLFLAALLLSTTVNSATLLILGDSLSAGYGIDEKKGWVNLLHQRLNGEHTIINGSISGDTTAGGLSRLPSLLEKYLPDFVLIELGGNDGLRGYSILDMKSNLKQMIEISREKRVQPLLLSIQIPSNYGPRYTQAFAAAYPEISEKHNVSLIPFVFEDVMNKPSLLQADGIHPTEQAQPLIAERMLRELTAILNL